MIVPALFAVFSVVTSLLPSLGLSVFPYKVRLFLTPFAEECR